MKGFAEVVEIPETKKDEKYIFGTIKNNGDSSYVTFDGSDFLTPITSAMGYEDGDRVMVMVKNHRAIVVNNMTSPAVTGKYVKENYASFENLSATNAQIGYLRANMITADVLEAKIGEFGYLKADQADLKFATIENLNASNAEISTLKATTIKTDNLAAEVAKLGYAEITDLNAATGRIDTLESSMITADNLRTEIAKIGYLTADEADIRYLTVSTADAKFLHADMSDMDIAKIQTLFATAGIVSDMTIKDGHITGELSGIKVSANDISAGRLDAATIEVVNLNAANITVGTINGTQIATGAIDLTKLGSDVTDKLADTEEDVAKAVVDAKKAIADSLTAQNTANSATSTANSALSTANSATSTANAANSLASTAKSTADSANSSATNAVNIANGISVGGRNVILNSNYEFVITSTEYGKTFLHGYTMSDYGNNGSSLVGKVIVSYDVYISDDFSFGSTNAWAGFNYRLDQGGEIYWSGGEIYFIRNLEKGRWIRLSNILEYTTIEGYVFSNINLFVRDFVGTIKFRNLKLEKGNKPTDWTPAPEDVDSSINTASIKNWCYDGNLAWMNGAKIYASTIVSDAIAADAITAVKIKAGAITADKIAANAVTADKIAANAVTAGTIAAGSITTDKLSAKAITSEKIATDAVTADKILAKSITAVKIASGTITSNEIAAGTIKASNINVTDLVGNSAFINSLRSNTVIVGLQNDINGISVGGRNLLLNSEVNPTNLVKWGAAAATISLVTEDDYSCYKVISSGNNGVLGNSVISKNILVPGETYTYSFWCKSNVNKSVNHGSIMHFQTITSNAVHNLTNPVFRPSSIVADTWTKLTATFQVTNRCYFRPYIWFLGNGTILHVRDLKLEKGNKATDWTPAPEDVDSLISAAQSTANSANTLAGTANSAAGAAQSTADSANTLAKSLDSISTKSYAFYGATGSSKWIKLGTLVSAGDATSFIITVYTGNGYNASPSQNSKLEIIIKDSWQPTASASDAFGVSLTTQNWNSPNVKVMASSSDVCDVWIYLPWAYWNGNYTISGYRESWTHSGASQADEPTSGTAQNIECRVNAEQAKSVADSAVSTIGKWCYNNDITYINGGKIYTGTVTADKINVSSLSAISANIGTVTAGTIQSNNYVKDVSGMKLSLTDGSWDSKYTKIDASGKISCSNMVITGGSIDLTGDTGDTVLVNIKKKNTTLRLSPNGIDQSNYNGNAGASGLKSETQTMSLKNRRIEINDTKDYTTYNIFSSAVIDIMAHADGGKTSLELHDNNGSTRVLTSSILTSKELSFSNNKKTWTVGISGTIPELLVSCDSTKVIEINPSWSLSGSGVGVGLNADLYMTGTAAYTTDGSRNVTTQTWCGKTVQLFPYVYGNGVYRLAYCGSYMEVASDAGAYGVTWWASDVRLKENFTPVNFDVLDCIRDLKFKAFDWKDKSKENIHQRLGLVADEVQCIIPEAVFEVGENKIKNINTGIMSTYALKGVQDLYARIRLLEQEVINLQNQLLQKGNQNG